MQLASWRPTSALDSSSGVASMWVQIPVLVSLSKTLNHNCFVLRMGRKAVGPVRCVMHVKEPRTLIVKEKGLAPVFLDSRLEHPAGWICARYKSYYYYYYYYYHYYQQQHSVIQMLQDLQWQTLNEQRVQNKVIMLYRMIHGLVALPSGPPY